MPWFKKKDKDKGATAEDPKYLPKDILQFLNEADERYISVYETRNIRLLKDYFTIECVRMIGSAAASSRGQRYFSSSRYRDTQWEVMSKEADEWLVRKSVVYSDIRAAGSVRMKVSQDYEEEWTLLVTDDEVLVKNIHLL